MPNHNSDKELSRIYSHEVTGHCTLDGSNESTNNLKIGHVGMGRESLLSMIKKLYGENLAEVNVVGGRGMTHPYIFPTIDIETEYVNSHDANLMIKAIKRESMHPITDLEIERISSNEGRLIARTLQEEFINHISRSIQEYNPFISWRPLVICDSIPSVKFRQRASIDDSIPEKSIKQIHLLEGGKVKKWKRIKLKEKGHLHHPNHSRIWSPKK